MMEKNTVIRWVSHPEEKKSERRNYRSYRDPTADAAVGNVMREEKRKRKQEKQKMTGRCKETHGARRMERRE